MLILISPCGYFKKSKSHNQFLKFKDFQTVIVLVMGPGQKFLTWVGSGQFFVARVGSGQPFMAWVRIWKILQYFSLRVKKNCFSTTIDLLREIGSEQRERYDCRS